MNPRKLALELLCKAEKNGQYTNIALDRALLESDLSEADRALCSALFYGVTERRISLDHRIAALSARPLQELDATVRNALRLGIYQLEFLDRIPPHAAIYETVAICQKKSAGFVNAVLRAHQRTPKTRLPDKETAPVSYLSIGYSVGEPLVKKLIAIYGVERAESLLDAFSQNPPTTLRVNTLKVDRNTLASRIEGTEPTALSPHGLHVRGALRSLYGFDEGLFFVQDEASQLCVEALGAKEGDTVLDICSCPGSKSFGSAIRMNNTGAIHAFDLHEKKLSLVVSGAQKLGITILDTHANDGRNFMPEWEGQADCVLCDVPCSGFGVIAKKPELRYKDPSVSEALPDIQQGILETACRYVKVGGTLVYSTCTIFPEENEENVARFLSSHPEFSLTPFRVGAFDCPTGQITLLPDRHPTDGFFIAKLTKKENT